MDYDRRLRRKTYLESDLQILFTGLDDAESLMIENMYPSYEDYHLQDKRGQSDSVSLDQINPLSRFDAGGASVRQACTGFREVGPYRTLSVPYTYRTIELSICADSERGCLPLRRRRCRAYSDSERETRRNQFPVSFNSNEIEK